MSVAEGPAKIERLRTRKRMGYEAHSRRLEATGVLNGGVMARSLASRRAARTSPSKEVVGVDGGRQG